MMDRGTNSITQLLNYILFNIVPTVVDIIVAIVYLSSAFNGWLGLVVFITMALYLSKLNNGNKNGKFNSKRLNLHPF